MSKKKYEVRGECPSCACGTITHLSTEQVKEKYIGPEDQFEMNCPICGTKHMAEVHEED